MHTHEWSWTNAEGLTFQSRIWEPDGGLRGVLVLVHGLASNLLGVGKDPAHLVRMQVGTIICPFICTNKSGP